MTSTLLASFPPVVRFVCAVCLFAAAPLWAQRPLPTVVQVTYSVPSKIVQINPTQLPYAISYPLTITSPANPTSDPAIASVYAGAGLTVNLTKVVKGTAADGTTPLDAATLAGALDDVTFHIPGTATPITTLTFTGANQPVTVEVRYAVPVDVVLGNYVFKLKAEGWPVILGVDPSAGGDVNVGSEINGSISENNARLPAPEVIIGTPADSPAGDITVDPLHLSNPTNLPLEIPFTFTARTTSVPPTFITAVDVEVSGPAGAFAEIKNLRLNGVLMVAGASLAPAYDVQGTATLRITKLGTHAITVRATDIVGGTASDTNTFVVRTTVPAPTVAIQYPHAYDAQAGAYVYPAGTAIPVNVSASTPFGGIQALAVTIDGQAVPVSVSGLATIATASPVAATGSATVTYATTGEHTITVTATDIYGQAAAPVSRTFKVAVPEPPRTDVTVRGFVFLDLFNKGTWDTMQGEPGLAGITVRLFRSGVAPITAVTTAGGAYSFTLPASATPVTAEVDVEEPAGLSPSDALARTVTLSAGDATVRPIGLELDFRALPTLNADGKSHGYWKSNLGKADNSDAPLAKGAQESKANLIAWTTAIGGFALPCLNDITSLAAATTALSGNDQLRIQLLAAEYNFMSGRFINQSGPLTFAFVAWGERVLQHSTNSAERAFAKDWMDAFNNSYGGKVLGPRP